MWCLGLGLETFVNITVIMPRPLRGRGIIKWWRCLYVCLSVRPSVENSRTNSRTERLKKLKIGRMEAHHISNQWTYLEVKKSKIKVTRPINAEIKSVLYLPKGKTYELGAQMEHEDPYHRQARWSPRSKVKVARSHGPSDRLAHKSRTKVRETPKLVGKLPTSRAITCTRFEVKRVINAETESVDYELQTW